MSEDTISFDSVLNLCQNQHRRIVLWMLADEQRSLTLDDLTKAVLKYNHLTPIAEASADVPAKTRLTLHHHHLPKLAAEGCINYDPARELAEPVERLEQVQPTLSAILDVDPTLEAPLKL